MAEISTWAWVVNTTWPGFTPGNQDNLGANGNYMPVDPGSYTSIQWVDAQGDDMVSDADTDDTTQTTADGVRVGGVIRTVAEVARFDGTIVLVDGSQLSVTMPVWLFSDGTWMARLNDSDIPAGKHFGQVTQITLGTWDGVEYDGTWISTRDNPFVCFAAGTMITTPTGEMAVESLVPGDLVSTLDHGPRPLSWIGTRRVAGAGRAAPVTIAAGALGNRRALRVSQQHRMLIGGWRAQLYTGEDEVLVAACHLVNDATIRITPCACVTYVHLLFDNHEIVMAEGIPSESFHPGAVALDRLGKAARDEVLALFPELSTLAQRALARPCITGWEGRMIAP